MGRRAKPAKVKAEAKRSLAGKSPKNAGSEVRDLEKRLAEALEREAGAVEREAEAREQQAATAEILRVISGSPMDVQPTFEAIAVAATRLCAAQDSGVVRFDGALMHLMANDGFTVEERDVLRAEFPRPADRGIVTGRAILTRAVAHVPDIQQDPDYNADAIRRGRFSRAVLSVPMLRGGHPIGAITVTRREAIPFSEAHIALLQTFADQAVIAIENVRLFIELEARNRDLMATGEILRVISSSPTDGQPAFDAIARNARWLLGGHTVSVARLIDDELHLMAFNATDAAADAVLQGFFPAPVDRFAVVARVVRERTPVIVTDTDTDPQVNAAIRELGRARGWRSVIWMPMVRDEASIGMIAVSRRAPGSFADSEVALLKTFADQAVIAIENVRLFTELQQKNEALTQAHAQVSEALEQQTATSEILRVISSSATDLQPVFDTIVRNAVRLCRAEFGGLHRVSGGRIGLDSQLGMPADELAILQRDVFPTPLSRESTTGRAILDGAVVHVRDIREVPNYGIPLLKSFRTILAVPMLREGVPVGALALWRSKVQPFSDAEIGLVQTFADQAVIAIENVRLFTELGERNRALTAAHAQVTEALEQQTATSDILGVISRSPTDVQPVFDTIVDSAARLCDAVYSVLASFDGKLIDVVAAHNWTPAAWDAARRILPAPPTRALASGRAILERAVVHVPDVDLDPDYGNLELRRTVGFRSLLAVPMIREGETLGAILVGRAKPGAFSDNQIALLRTFADQAVIAIENVRLFNELQASNRDLTTALDKQTATSDILRVISRSQTDVQPVFDSIVAAAVRLLGAYQGVLTRIVGDEIHHAASTFTSGVEDPAVRAAFPRSLHAEGTHAQAIRDRVAVNIADAQTDPALSEERRALARTRGYRSLTTVPLLRHGEALGTIAVTRREAGGFTDHEIALLQTFADQAVIAIENVRLFRELEARTQELTRSVGELRALGEVGQAISSTLDLETVLSTIVARATQLASTDAGVIYEYDEPREVFLPRATEHLEADIVETMLATPVRKGEGATGQLAEVQEPIQVPDILEARAESRVRGALVRAGYRALLAVPLVREGALIGGLTVIRKTTGEFTPEVIDLMRTFATQSALAIQNARLFLEIEDKSRQLEAASQHKSEFLANMSHELRTPMNAILGFSEVLAEGMFGEINDKQAEYLRDILESGRHLLSLINDILDLSKIEAGRMELEPADFDLPGAIDNALTLVRERAGRRGITLGREIDERVGMVQGDERKVKQVLLNLLSNALKFTPEGGRIDVRAALSDGMAEVSVADTGVGIAPEDQEAVFEEFRQVGTADKKVEGTGLGLALSRKFIELHGGQIWVKSQVGTGSTFTFTIPVRREPGDRETLTH
jgi:GAF domain-containing protein